MHRTLLPKIQIILILLAVSAAFGQSKAAGEVDPAKCWSYPTGGLFGGTLLTDNPHVYIGSSGAKVDTVSLDGKKAWSTEFGGDIRSNILATTNGVFVITSTASPDKTKPADVFLRNLSGETGITIRTQKLPPADRFFLHAVNGSLIVVSSGGTIELLDGKDGTPLWKRDIADGFAGEPVFSAEKVTVATTSGQLFVISRSNGEIESMRKMPFAVTALGNAADGELIAGDERGNVLMLSNGADRPYWKFKSGGSISKVADAKGEVLAVSNDNFVYLLNDRNGGVIWKKRMPGRIAATAVYDNKYIVVAGVEEHSALLLDLSKGKVAGQIKLADDETVTAIQTTPSSILLLTSDALYSYSLNGCGQK